MEFDSFLDEKRLSVTAQQKHRRNHSSFIPYCSSSCSTSFSGFLSTGRGILRSDWEFKYFMPNTFKGKVLCSNHPAAAKWHIPHTTHKNLYSLIKLKLQNLFDSLLSIHNVCHIYAAKPWKIVDNIPSLPCSKYILPSNRYP